MSKMAEILVASGYLLLVVDVGDKMAYVLILIGHIIHISHLRFKGSTQDIT